MSVNSRERAERARTLFGNVLGARIGPPLTEIQSIEQLMAARTAASKPEPAAREISPEQRRGIIHQSMDRHYRRMLDEPVPMLGNRSPRKAVKTDAGQEKVVAWLKTLENHSANIVDPNDPWRPMISLGCGLSLGYRPNGADRDIVVHLQGQ